MKKIVFMIMFLSLFSKVTLFADENGLISIYNSLPTDFVTSSETWLTKKYLIEKVDNKWTTKSLNGIDVVFPIVDSNNGYLSIIDKKISSSFTMQNVQLALFINSKKQTFVGYSINAKMAGGFESYFCFFISQGGHYINCTNQLLENFSYKEFFKKNYVGNEKIHDMFSNLIKIKLPQYGTDILFELDVDPIKFYLSHEFSDKERNIIAEALGNISYKTITMKWNQDKGLFETISKK